MTNSLKILPDKKALPESEKIIFREGAGSVSKPPSSIGPASEKGVFVNMKGDFGIKRLFKSEEGKEDFKRMINALVEGFIPPLEHILFENSELVGRTKYERNAVLDIFFKDNDKRIFNLEMQQNSLDYMLHRSYCYSCRYHSEMMQPGKDYKFNHNPITCLIIADFNISGLGSNPCITLHQMGNMENGEVTINSPQILTIELPKFKKTLDELNGEKDVFLYLLAHMGDMEEIPPSLDNEKYRPLFERARIANFNKTEMKRFNAFNKAEETRQLEILTGARQGREEGIVKGRVEAKTEIVFKLLSDNIYSLEQIARIADLPLLDVKVMEASLAHA